MLSYIMILITSLVCSKYLVDEAMDKKKEVFDITDWKLNNLKVFRNFIKNFE